MGLFVTPRKRKQLAKRRQRQEKSWAKKNGPVSTRKATKEELGELPM